MGDDANKGVVIAKGSGMVVGISAHKKHPWVVASIAMASVLVVFIGAGSLWLAKHQPKADSSTVQGLTTPLASTPGPSAGAGAAKSPPASDRVAILIPEMFVSYSDKGFLPADMGTITAGQKVTFSNYSSASLWVSSGDKPGSYPGLDSMKELKPNESYSFTFAKAGSWSYFDKLNTSHTGKVTVK